MCGMDRSVWNQYVCKTDTCVWNGHTLHNCHVCGMVTCVECSYMCVEWPDIWNGCVSGTTIYVCNDPMGEIVAFCSTVLILMKRSCV